jgi:hypothetical protein
MKPKQKRYLALAGAIILLYFIVSPLAIQEQENTVTVTPQSPTIEINGIQYHYEPFPLTIQRETKDPRFLFRNDPSIAICPTTTAQYETNQLIGKFSAAGVGHNVVINYDILNRFAARKGFSSTDFNNNCRAGLDSRGLTEYGVASVKVKDAYINAQHYTMTGQTGWYGTTRPSPSAITYGSGSYINERWTPKNQAGGYFYRETRSGSDWTRWVYYNVDKQGDIIQCRRKKISSSTYEWDGPKECQTTEGRRAIVARGTQWADPPSEYIWVTVDDVLVKIQISATSVTSFGVHSGSIWYGYTGYVMKAWIYVPSHYLKPSYCGDKVCDLTEDCRTCEEDCGACVIRTCGNGVCDAGENFQVCPADCQPIAPFCGDGFCNGDETCASCAQDCGSCIEFYCGDGKCNGNETCVTCPQDCGQCPPACGDGKCELSETPLSCPKDCGLPYNLCGNGLCDPGEDCRCSDCKCSQYETCSPESEYKNLIGCVPMRTDDPEPQPEPEPVPDDYNETDGDDLDYDYNEEWTPLDDEPSDWFQDSTLIPPYKNWEILVVAGAVILIIFKRKPIKRWIKKQL